MIKCKNCNAVFSNERIYNMHIILCSNKSDNKKDNKKENKEKFKEKKEQISKEKIEEKKLKRITKKKKSGEDN